jgi:hypothetical protein
MWELSLLERAIPRNQSDRTKISKPCDIHSDDSSDILKTLLKTVNGKRIEVPSRGRIKATAVPIKFPSKKLDCVVLLYYHNNMSHFARQQIAHHISAGWSNLKPPLFILKHHKTN